MEETTISETPWPVTTNRYVGFIDIMGFKDMVMRLPHERVYELMKRSNESAISNQKIKWTSGANLIKSFSFSDSIIFFSKSDSVECFQSFIYYTSALTQDLFEDAIPHKRGPIIWLNDNRYGKFNLFWTTVNRCIFVTGRNKFLWYSISCFGRKTI